MKRRRNVLWAVGLTVAVALACADAILTRDAARQGRDLIIAIGLVTIGHLRSIRRDQRDAAEHLAEVLRVLQEREPFVPREHGK